MPDPFNLLDAPWLPCRLPGDGGVELSLREALLRAHEIQALADPSPLATAALHRLLLAVLHRVFGPASPEGWAGLWRSGRFDGERLGAYLEAWRQRFDLFDPAYPFYQSAGLPAEAATTVAKLGHEHSAGNNPLLFDHSQDAAPEPLSPAAAARYVVMHQAFAIGGLVGRLPGEPPSATSAHLVKAAVQLVTGANLFQTLVLNMVPVAGEFGLPFEFDPDRDAPAWEQDEPVRPADREPRGYLDLLTWQSRRLLLFPEDDGRVRRAAVMGGWQLPAQWSPRQHETMAAYRKRENVAKNQDPWFPVGFVPERALWRDSTVLLQEAEDTHERALTLRSLASLQRDGYLDPSLTFGLAMHGLASDRAKVFLWRSEVLPIPLAYLRDRDLVSMLEDGIGVAEGVAATLRRAVFFVAQEALAPTGNADRGRVGALADSLAPERAYWPALDVPFRRFLADLPAAASPDGLAAVRAAWAAAIRDAASDAFETTAGALETTARGYRAAALERGRFRGQVAGSLIRAGLVPAPTPASQLNSEVTR